MQNAEGNINLLNWAHRRPSDADEVRGTREAYAPFNLKSDGHFREEFIQDEEVVASHPKSALRRENLHDGHSERQRFAQVFFDPREEE